ncbi:hypothetical protein [Streptomyces sp. KL2]|uniref:hypothetical protein n=1 Tax=Streptomyces sp. KL2 TaxID=3050126 RepID=UPI00397B0865
MGSLWKRSRLRTAVLGVAALAAVTAVAVYPTRDGEHPKTNRAQVRKACAGLLPAAHLDPFLPRDSAMKHGQYGTLLEPGHESRAFIDCRLDWTGDDGKGDLGVHMRAEPWGPDDVLPSADDGDALPFPYRLPDGSRGAITAHDMYGDMTQVGVILQVGCPKGDFERFRLGTDMKVSVELPVRLHDEDDDGYTDEPVEEELRLAARSAPRAADRVREHQACGTAPLGKLSPAPVSERDDDGDDGGAGAEDERGGSPCGKGTCAWLDPAAMGYPKGEWRVSGGSSFGPARGECRAALDGHPEENEIKGVDAVSVSGVGARGFYQGDETGPNEHEAGGHHEPGPGWTAVPDGTAELLPGDARTLPSLALWAESVCDGGQTFHRISITPELGYHLDSDGKVTRHEEGGPALGRAARGELSRTARAALDRYLAAPGGWPQRAHCRGTTVLGEVEEWRSIDDE